MMLRFGFLCTGLLGFWLAATVALQDHALSAFDCGAGMAGVLIGAIFTISAIAAD